VGGAVEAGDATVAHAAQVDRDDHEVLRVSGFRRRGRRALGASTKLPNATARFPMRAKSNTFGNTPLWWGTQKRRSFR
jgi:hypothetical protein